MTRLPVPGSDQGQWGQILNDFLLEEHNADGTLKKSALITGAEQTANKGQPNGYAPLDSSSKVPAINLPAAAPDADASTKGLIQLTGDLSGTAASPTVPALANKVDTSDSRLSDARLTILKNGNPLAGGTGAGTRKNLNLKEGTNTTLTVTDNGTDTVDVTVSLAGGAGANGIPETIVDAKGDLIAATGPDTVTRLPVGTDNLVLTADSTTGTGLKWTAANNGHVIQKDGAATTQRPILDFEGGPLVIDDAANNRTKVYLLREYLNITDPRIGVVMNASGDQGPQLQAGLNLAGSNLSNVSLFIPPGVVECYQQLNVPDANIRILGAGAGPDKDNPISAIYFPEDQGAGTFGLNMSSITATYHIEKLGLMGPGTFSTTTPMGDFPHDSNGNQTQMYGMYNPTRNFIEDVRIMGFAAAVAVTNDHQEWHSCDFRGNGYGMDWIDNPSGGLGDQYLDKCILTDQTRAGIAVSWNNTIANARFISCEFGNSPYALYRYTGGGSSRSTFLVGCIFDNCSFVNCANAIIYDEPGKANVQGNIGVTFDGMYEAGTFTGPAWGTRRPAAFDTYSVSMHWRASAMPLYASKYTVAAAFITVTDDYFDFETMNTLGQKPFLAETFNANHNVDGVQLGATIRGSGTGGSARVAAEAISKGDIVELADLRKIQRCRANSFSQVAGIAAHDAASGDACVFLNQADSPNLLVKNKSGVSIVNGSLIKPDSANIGCVKAATGPGDVPVIGRVTGGDIANNASGQAQILI
jgi:hypothetical protein